MTDNTSAIAGSYAGSGPVIECILDEGAPTYAATSIGQNGMLLKTVTFASQLEEGMVVALSNDTANTYAATEGMPVVEKAANGESLVIGQIVSTPELKRFPSSTNAACYAALKARGVDAGYPKAPVLPIEEAEEKAMLAGFRELGML